MQVRDWNGFRYLLAIQRGRTLAVAARTLGVDNTTVARRLKTMEESFGGPLFQRGGDGTLSLTPKGQAVAQQAELIERHVLLLENNPGTEPGALTGTVRITSIPIIVNRLLLPEIHVLLDQFPGLQLELLPESSNLSLTRREADLALRLARPKTGGTQIKARRIADLDYAEYASAIYTPEEVETLPWITYDDAMAHVPQARWIAKTAKDENVTLANVKVRDGESLFEAVSTGLGRSLLPVRVADRDKRLARVRSANASPILSRELWLLGHRDQLKLPHIKVVVSWINVILAQPGSAQ